MLQGLAATDSTGVLAALLQKRSGERGLVDFRR